MLQLTAFFLSERDSVDAIAAKESTQSKEQATSTLSNPL
jgi:hypothetical protein